MKAKWKHFWVKVLKVFEGDFFKENHAQITISSKITYLNFFDSMRKRGNDFKYNSLYPRFLFFVFFSWNERSVTCSTVSTLSISSWNLQQ